MGNRFALVDDLIVCAGYPGEQHSLKEYITPDQYMVKELYDELASGSAQGDFVWNSWDWVCRQIRYPVNWLGRFTDKHELNAFGLRRLKSVGEFFQMPYQTLVVRIGDCFDTSSLLASLLRRRMGEVYVALGTFSANEEIDHAWVETGYGDTAYLLETTLREPGVMRPVSEMTSYKAMVKFNDRVIMSQGNEDSLFCHPISNPGMLMNAIGKYWGCQCKGGAGNGGFNSRR